MAKMKDLRVALLDEAAELISGQREEDYGHPRENFTRIAALWSQVFDLEVTPEQVALCMILLKVSRLIKSPDAWDSWVDAAGYAGLGGELSQ